MQLGRACPLETPLASFSPPQSAGTIRSSSLEAMANSALASALPVSPHMRSFAPAETNQHLQASSAPPLCGCAGMHGAMRSPFYSSLAPLQSPVHRRDPTPAASLHSASAWQTTSTTVSPVPSCVPTPDRPESAAANKRAPLVHCQGQTPSLPTAATRMPAPDQCARHCVRRSLQPTVAYRRYPYLPAPPAVAEPAPDRGAIHRVPAPTQDPDCPQRLRSTSIASSSVSHSREVSYTLHGK